jgi:serine/threonine protein kinase
VDAVRRIDTDNARFSGTDRFLVLERIGAGGMGDVYRAYDRDRDRWVALKLLRSVDGAALYRFKREFRSLADVSHPHLVSLYELTRSGDRWFFTMELLDGFDYHTYVRGPTAPLATDPLEPPFARAGGDAVETATAGVAMTELLSCCGRTRPPRTDIAAVLRCVARAAQPLASPVTRPEQIDRLRRSLVQLTRGVAALHRAGHLHRDIKPSNIIVTRGERVVLVDFGIAVEVARAGSNDLPSDRIVGTPMYIAPEQLAGSPASPASDWYAVGVTLYELLTGFRPYGGGNNEVLAAKQSVEPYALRELASGAPRDLADLCERLMARDPGRRPNGDEILRRLGGTEPLRFAMPVYDGDTLSPGRLVARRDELAALRAAFDDVRSGEARIARVHGESGIGKTALLTELVGELQSEHAAVVLAGRCYERESVPYKAIDTLIDSLCRHLLELPRAQAWDLVPPDAPALARMFPILRRIEAVLGASEESLGGADVHELKRRGAACLRELLRRLSRRAPLVLWIDDLQWGDTESAALLADIAAGDNPPALLLVCSHRSADAITSPCVRALVEAVPGAIELPIGPLPPSQATELALAMLPTGGRGATARAEAIAREAGGNPYLVVELARHLQCGDRKVELDESITLDAVIRSRLRELPATARVLLETVAVAARPITQRTAYRATIGLDDASATTTLLRSARLVRTRGPFDKDLIEPYHDRIRETVVALIDDDRLEAIHGRLAQSLEAAGEAVAADTHRRSRKSRSRAGALRLRAIALTGRDNVGRCVWRAPGRASPTRFRDTGTDGRGTGRRPVCRGAPRARRRHGRYPPRPRQ